MRVNLVQVNPVVVESNSQFMAISAAVTAGILDRPVLMVLAAGRAIDGVSYVTKVGTGDIRGTEIN
jgi:hypothetical protein